MTKLSAGMERFLARLTGPECMAKRDACDQAAALIRAYEEEREAQAAWDRPIPKDGDLEAVRETLFEARHKVDSLKAELET